MATRKILKKEVTRHTYIYACILTLLCYLGCVNDMIMIYLNDCYIDPLLDQFFTIAVPLIHAEWRIVADYLDYPPAEVQAIYQRGRVSGSIHCCKELFTDWYHSDNGVKPCSWEALIGALRYSRFGDISSHIEKELVKSMYVYYT